MDFYDSLEEKYGISASDFADEYCSHDGCDCVLSDEDLDKYTIGGKHYCEHHYEWAVDELLKEYYNDFTLLKNFASSYDDEFREFVLDSEKD